jgi:cold shock CspA family protein
MSFGTIKKLILVAPREPNQPKEGYGIILSQDGREVFFLHSAVADDGFEELQSGQTVGFSIEDGPLGRASAVVPFKQELPLSDNRQH